MTAQSVGGIGPPTAFLEQEMEQVTLYLHIGSHKTGTTALQEFLLNNKSLLAQKGYLYPSTGLVWQGHHQLAWACQQEPKVTVSDQRIWTMLQQEIEEVRPKNVIISSEDFWSIKDWDGIQSFTEKFNTKIISYLRRQDGYMQSLYNELVKQEEVRVNIPIHEYVQHHLSSKMDVDYTNFESSLAKWRERFGKQNMIVRVYEKSQLPEGIFTDFLQAIGLQRTEEYKLSKEGNINPSLNSDILEFLRLCNTIPIGAYIHRQMFNSLAKISRNFGEKAYFEQHNLLSPQQRLELLQRYESSNQQVAREYLGREDGRLFYEPWPAPDEPWERYAGLPLEKLVQIVAGLWAEQQEEINALKQSPRCLKQDLGLWSFIQTYLHKREHTLRARFTEYKNRAKLKLRKYNPL